MKKFILLLALTLASTTAWCDFSCPEGLDAACLNNDDKVCHASARCVANDAVCFDNYACEADDAYVCESEFDEVSKQNETLVNQFNDLASKHNALLNQKSENERCVISASTLEAAKQCVL